MDKTKIKRIVAREGLIIISLILFASTYFLVPNRITIKDLKTPIDTSKQAKYEITTDLGRVYTVIINKGSLTDAESDELMGLIQEKYNAEEKEAPNYFSEENLTVIKEEILSDYIKTKILLIALFGYPLYLLIRFIIWAIKILRER